MSDADWADRLRRSRQVMRSWQWETKLPWVDPEMTLSIAETELGVLRYFVPLVPDALQAELATLLQDWDEFRMSLLKR